MCALLFIIRLIAGIVTMSILVAIGIMCITGTPVNNIVVGSGFISLTIILCCGFIIKELERE